MIFPYHQLQCLVGLLVVYGQGFVGRYVGRVGKAHLKLYQTNYTIVDERYEFGAYAFAHERLFLYLQAAYALGLDKQLVGERRGAQYAPRRAVVVKFLGKQCAAFCHGAPELFFCFLIVF